MVVRIDRYDRSYHLDLNLFRNPASRANFMVASAREKVQRQHAVSQVNLNERSNLALEEELTSVGQELSRAFVPSLCNAALSSL